MPQGAPKSRPKASKPTTASAKSKSAKAATQRHRVAKSKSVALAHHQQEARKGAGRLTGLLETTLAARAGYVEMIGKKKKEDEKKAEVKATKRNQGGK